jgi:hypothetical protein
VLVPSPPGSLSSAKYVDWSEQLSAAVLHGEVSRSFSPLDHGAECRKVAGHNGALLVLFALDVFFFFFFFFGWTILFLDARSTCFLAVLFVGDLFRQ